MGIQPGVVPVVPLELERVQTHRFQVDRPDEGEPSDGSAQLMAGILAGLGGDRTRLAMLHEAFERWQEGLEDDDIDPVRATIVRLAADGLWLAALLGLPQLDKRLARKVLAALNELTRS